MKKWKFSKRIAAFLLAMSMMLNLMPSTAMAAVGDKSNVDTGLTGDIDTNDTISLPIKILDYEADGMLFEFAESYVMKSAYDFGSKFCQVTDAADDIGQPTSGGFNTTLDLTVGAKSNTYVNYLRLTYNSATSNNWLKGNSGCYISTYNEKDSDGNWKGVLSTLTNMDDVRYVTLVYRSNVSTDYMYFAFGDNNTQANTSGYYTGAYDFTNKGADGEGSSTNWTYVVYDLKTGTLGSNWSNVSGPNYFYIGLPLDTSNDWIDLAHVAFFSDKDAATAFGEYALTDGSNRGDNRGFGLLRGSRNQGDAGNAATNGLGSAFPGIFAYNNTSADYGNAAATIYQIPWNEDSTLDLTTVTNLGYTLLGTYDKNNIANIGLLESSIGSNGYPVYKEEVVTYMAYLLKHSLELDERTSDGWKNYRYVKGTASSVYGGTDLATALRNAIDDKTISNGDCDAAAKKNLVGTWSAVSGNISTYHDAAYFLLNSIFVPGSYNVVKNDFNYLVLSSGTDKETGEKVYVFDGGFTTSATAANAQTAVDYNTTDHTIQNTSAAGKTHIVYEGDKTTTMFPFLPVTDRNTADGMTKNPYYQDDGIINSVKKVTDGSTLYKRNYGFAMVSEGEFVYHADDELFFDFEGDDDVYLFINGELVMDIGSAHSIDGVRFELNDYVNAAKAGTLGSAARNKALALEEGNTYSFKFYYMERHSYGSNIRIMTNIRVTDPSMATAKTAWQAGTQLDFGSIVDYKEVVEYGFAITNNGEENLYNLTFADSDIGVTLDYTNGLKVTGSRVYDVNGGTLEASDLTAVVTHPDYDDINVTFSDNDALKMFLKELTASGTESGGGLYVGATVLIRGIGYKLTDAQVKAGVFDNTVLTTSTNKTESKTLHGQATMRVFVPADPMYYEWEGHNLSVTKTKLVTDVMAAANQSDNILNGKVSNLTTSNVNKIELVTKAGTAISSPYVTIDGSYNLTINYDTVGSKVFYVKITYNSSKNTVIVPVLVNVTNVEDSIYVLDYGLSVDLTANDELFKNDVLTVPGRTTLNGILGIGSNGAYSPNEITFAKDEDGKIQNNDGYGEYVFADKVITYTPNKFMNDIDTVQVAINVYESGITPSKISGTLNINKEVEMYKNISVLPANVVYYEDDFPAITYTTNADGDGNVNTFTQVGDGSSDLSQSNDQESNYGSDDTYADASSDEYSGKSLTKITIADSDMTAKFTFKGTGFELIGRTNASDSATLIVRVKDASGNIVKVIPVINEFDNGANGGDEEIYQVPVIRVKDLSVEPAEYTVEISGVPANIYDENGNKTGTKATYLYVDGLRIFQPLGASDEIYLGTEDGAQFVEIRDLILEGKAAVSVYDGLKTDAFSGNLSWTENLNGEDHNDVEYVGNQVSSVDQYLTMGPNNEVYMNGALEDTALVFYVMEDSSSVHNLQIAVRAIDPAKFFIGGSTPEEQIPAVMNVDLQYGVVDTNGNFGWTSVKTVASSTEQYYTIDYTKCPTTTIEGKTAYQVAIKPNSGFASFSSLKYNGLEIEEKLGDAATLKYVDGILTNVESGEAVDTANYISFSLLSRQMRSTTLMSEEDLEEIPQMPGSDVDTPEVEEPVEDENGMPDQNDYTNRAEFIKKLIEFLKKFWGR